MLPAQCAAVVYRTTWCRRPLCYAVVLCSAGSGVITISSRFSAAEKKSARVVENVR